MSGAHTPGPWAIEEAHGTEGQLCFLYITPQKNAAEPYRGLVASLTDAEDIEGISWPETHANAALIVTAPKLFDALETLVDALTTGAGRDFIEAFCRDGMAALEEASPGWHLTEPTRAEVCAKARVRAVAPALIAEAKHAARLLAAVADRVRTVDIEGDRFDLLAEAERIDALVAKATGAAS